MQVALRSDRSIWEHCMLDLNPHLKLPRHGQGFDLNRRVLPWAGQTEGLLHVQRALVTCHSSLDGGYVCSLWSAHLARLAVLKCYSHGVSVELLRSSL